MLRKLIDLFGGGTAATTALQPQLCATAGIPLSADEEIHTYSTLFGMSAPSTHLNGMQPIQNQANIGQKDELQLGFLRREPIFSHQPRQVIGHELMLNNSSELLGGGTSPMLHRIHDELLLKSILALDIPQLIGDELVFIHVSPATLEHVLILQLPGRNVVLAFRPEVENADRLMTRCRELKSHGFRFSLDDFTYSPGLYPLLGQVDFVRFDITPNSLVEIGPQLEKIPRLSEKTLIAKNVHTPEAFNIASLLAFRHYQGSHPEQAAPALEPPISRYRAKIIMLMNMLKNHVEASEFEQAMKQDGALAFRLLRYINSPANGLTHEAHSISEALTSFGHDTLHRWLSLLLFCQESSPCHHRTLLENALLRARLTELFGQRRLAAEEKAGLFVTGIFSYLDLLFKMPLDKALSHFSLSLPMGEALLRQSGPYAPFLKLAKACEDHDQPSIEHHANLAGISLEQVNTIYVKALVWAHEIEN